MNIISILAPILILVSLGYLLMSIRFLPQDFFRGATKLIYWIGLPSLLLYKIANAEVDYSASWHISLIMIAATVCTALLGLLVGRFTVSDSGRRKTFIHTSFHSNTSFVGLPVILYALGSNPQLSGLADTASIAIAPMIPFVHILTIFIMGGSGSSSPMQRVLHAARRAFLNPLVLACLIGLVLTYTGLTLPAAVNRGLDSLGKMALPLALLSIGAGLNFRTVKTGLPLTITAAVFNVVVLPLFGLLFSRMIGLDSGYTLIALIFLACPTAATAFVYAREMRGDHILAGNVIVISTMLSAASLWTVLYLFL